MRKQSLVVVGLIISTISFFLPAISGSDMIWVFSLPGIGGQIILFLVGLVVTGLPFLQEIYSRAKAGQAIFVTTSHRQNWERAISLCKSLKDGEEAYDTTSVMNEPEFEKVVEKAVMDNKVTYYRLFCCSPEPYDDKESPYRLFMEMLSPGKVQSAKDNGWVREATKTGRLRIYHLPHSLHIDFFIIARGSIAERGLCGFATKGSARTYVSGISFDNIELGTAFRDFYIGNLLEEARHHQTLVGQGKMQCFCRDFLPPNQPFDFLLPE